MNDRYLQVLRSIDKFDKIGRDGVLSLLQKPVEEFGANLDPVSAGIVGLFLDTSGETNDQTISNMMEFFKHASKVRCRLEVMAVLEESIEDDGKTAWDRLLAMRTNADETWNNDGRPANIAWALDDMVIALRSTIKSEYTRNGIKTINQG